jgi:hypothetical protein
MVVRPGRPVADIGRLRDPTAHVPLQDTDRVRPSSLLPAPEAWYSTGPEQVDEVKPPWSPRFGSTGPNLGYGLKLARRLEGRVE